jgi:hypothetical protein
MKTETSKNVETTELSQGQLDLVAGGIHFYVPNLQTGAPPAWYAAAAAALQAEMTPPYIGF